MFHNLKYVGIFILGLVTALAFLLGLFFKYTAIDSILLNIGNQQSETVAAAYNSIIWERYYPFISYLAKNKADKELYPQFNSFANESSHMFNDKTGLVAVRIYSNDNLLWDLKPNTKITEGAALTGKFLDSTDSKAALKEAISGNITSILIPSAVFSDGNTKTNKAIIKYFIPLGKNISDPQTANLAKIAGGTLELTFDISGPWQAITIIEYIIIATIITSFSIMLIIFWRMSQKAEILVEKQHDASVELASAKATAEAENQEKSRFLANVSHELRTPLNAIIGFSEIISSESMGPLNNEHYKGFIKDIHTSSVHLLSLINDILDFSKIEENKFEVSNEEVDITKTIMVCLRMMTAKAEELKVHLTEELPKEHIIVMLDAKRIKQVILNLVSNAVKFTPPDGTVKVKCWIDDNAQSVFISITDTGVGMEAQDIAKALTPFKQIDNKLSKQHAGTGLGLPLTKRLVELMKGKFNIMSELGLGTTVTINFPLPQADG